jgi:acyl carrier protein
MTLMDRQPNDMCTTDGFLNDLVLWMNRRIAPPDAVIGPDTVLFANGLLDSIRILLLIAWTERAIGRPIPDEQIRMDNFETPRRIAAVFAGR